MTRTEIMIFKQAESKYNKKQKVNSLKRLIEFQYSEKTIEE